MLFEESFEVVLGYLIERRIISRANQSRFVRLSAYHTVVAEALAPGQQRQLQFLAALHLPRYLGSSFVCIQESVDFELKIWFLFVRQLD